MRSSRAILAAVLGVVAIGAAAWWSWREPASEAVTVRGRDERRAPDPETPAAAPGVAATRSEESPDRVERIASDPSQVAAIASGNPNWKPVLLHVLDRETRESLRDVRVSVLGQSPDDPVELQDPAASIAIRGDSPVTVGPELGRTAVVRFLVEAPRHASGSIALDFESGGERELLLEPACQLRIRLEAPPDPSEADAKVLGEKLVLELRRFSDMQERLRNQIAGNEAYAAAIGRKSSPWLRTREEAMLRMRERKPDPEASIPALAAAGLLTPVAWTRRGVLGHTTSFDSFAPGDWLVVVVSEDQRDRSLGAVVARLVAGETVERTIVVRSPPVPVYSISGTLLLDPGWNLDAATRQPSGLVLERCGVFPGATSAECRREVSEFRFESGGKFTWRADGLPAGIYFAQLEQYGFCSELEIDPESPQEFEIVVPAPCDVELSAVDTQTRERAKVKEVLHWTGDGDGIYSRVAHLDEVDDRFRFRAPLGRLHVRFHMFDDRYFMTEKAFDLAPGLNDLVFELAPRAAVRIELRDGTARVPWDDPHLLIAQRVGGRGTIMGWSLGARDVEYFLSPAGRYRIAIEGVPGFERSEPVEVDVVAGQVVDVTIPLTRAR